MPLLAKLVYNEIKGKSIPYQQPVCLEIRRISTLDLHTCVRGLYS